jgi:DNA-binding IclR family transcriptional regulator
MIRSLQKGIDILCLFNRDRPSLTVKEIASSIGVPLATAYRLVMTLRKKGLIEPDSRTGHYSLGLKLLELSGAIHFRMDLESIAIPFLKKLAEFSDETVQLNVYDFDRGICIYVEESTSTLRMAPRRGDVLPLHAGASMQAILAFLPKEDQDRILRGPLKRFTPNTLTNLKDLGKRLVRIRQQGYVVTSGEVYIGSVGIAAPVFNREDRVTASIAVSGPTQRMTKERKERIRSEIIRTAKMISEALASHSV